jgi:hypothetical protein
MIYKNEEIYDLKMAPEEIKKIEKYFHNKFPVEVVYPPERIQKSRLPHNRLPDKPASISFPFKATVKTANGMETWRYAENVIIDEKGVKHYIPAKFEFSGSKFLQRNDIEQIFFLLRKSEYCVGGDNQGIRTKFMFKDLVSEADKRMEKKMLTAKIDALLFGEMALSDDRIKEVAIAYLGLTDANEFTINQLKLKIFDKTQADKDGPDELFRMTNAGEEIKARVSIAKVIGMNVLHCDETNRKWYWKTKTGTEVVKGGQVPPNKSPMDALYALYLGDEGFRDDIQAVLLTKNPKAGKE